MWLPLAQLIILFLWFLVPAASELPWYIIFSPLELVAAWYIVVAVFLAVSLGCLKRM